MGDLDRLDYYGLLRELEHCRDTMRWTLNPDTWRWYEARRRVVGERLLRIRNEHQAALRKDTP